MDEEVKKILGMTAETVGKDLLGALVQEIKLLPDVWVKLSESRQEDIIDRLRKRVSANVQTAVHMIQGRGRMVVKGELEQVAIKDDVKATLRFSQAAANINELYLTTGKPVMVILSGSEEFTGGMDEVKPMPDQPEFPDINPPPFPSDGDNGDVVDADVKLLGND